MKLVVAWLAALLIAVVTASSCSINHKSGEYQCNVPSDCDPFPGRVCTDGFCVVPGGTIDARTDGPTSDGPRDGAIDGPFCPSQCTSCNQPKHECVIDCATTNCNNEVICPAGWNCTIGCTTANSCAQGVDCSSAASCNIACSGVQSCRDIVCGPGACKVACTGRQSCQNTDCFDSCACDVTCVGVGTGTGASCEGTTCPLGCGGPLPGRCSSALNGCNTCP